MAEVPATTAAGTKPQEEAAPPSGDQQKKRGGFKFRYVMAIIAPMIGYYVWRRRRRTTIEEAAAEQLVSPKRGELSDLERRLQLSVESWYELSSRIKTPVFVESLGSLLVEFRERQEEQSKWTAETQLYGWDALCLFRHSPTPGNPRALQKRDVLVGLAQLTDRNRPELQLELAWKAYTDSDSQT
jgi:hypothetical protein